MDVSCAPVSGAELSGSLPSTVASGGNPPGPPPSGGEQCQFVSLQQYQVPLHAGSDGPMHTAPTMHGSAGQLEGGTEPFELPVVPLLSPPQAVAMTRMEPTTAVSRARTAVILPRQAVPCPPLLPRERSDACAAASRAMGTRNGLQLT